MVIWHGPFIDGLPLKNGWIFHGYVSHNQMVNPWLLVTSPRTSKPPSRWRQATLSLLEWRPFRRGGRQRGPGGGRFWTKRGMGWWLVVWNMNFIFPNSWDDDPIWLSYFSGGKVYHQPGWWVSLWLLKKVGLSENHAGVMCRAGVFSSGVGRMTSFNYLYGFVWK